MTEIQYVTITKAAEHFNVHPQTIRAWLAKGAPHLRVGRVVRIDLDKLLAQESPQLEG